MTTSRRCTRCGMREARSPIIPTLVLHDEGGHLRVSLRAEPLCTPCSHEASEALAAAQRRYLQNHPKTWSPEQIRAAEDHLSAATTQASPEDWRLLAAALRDMEELLGSPLPPELRRFLRHEAGGDNEASA